ncbi:hypothetical protein [Pelagicoccus sp. SDUM812003]|uniref:hypothetical protein n=1 Tax=Pelagicoccus sp. SDUM812003 TaxID=3041267 RepID=UPI00280EE292|nr:hypothetical protein [Pelagicoccus sp. SDUM812003]MDQ8203729.1 hypothetical protein [Pelagicoccus sp. SDUM812003]
MESDYLKQLRQQKELLLKHLDWIDQQIDRECLNEKPSPSPKTSRLLETFEPDRPISRKLEIKDPESLPKEQVATDIYEQLGPDTKSAAQQTRRGCLLFSVLFFALFGGLVAYIYYAY